jgi:hypothetical protein
MVYPHRIFSGTSDVAAAVRVLSAHVSRTSYGRGTSDIQIAGSLADQVEDLLNGDAWASFHFRGQEIAGWADGQLQVHGSGPWDASLDRVSHALKPWSWLDIGVSHARGGGSCDPHDPLPQCVRRHFGEETLIAWFAPVDVDTISVWGETVSARRSIRKLSDQLMVSEPITQKLLNAPSDDPALIQWWTDVLDRVGAKYRLGGRSDRPNQHVDVPPPDEVELRIELSDGAPPEDLLDTITMELEDLGAEVDDWFTQGDCICLPVSGTDLPRLLERGAEIARAAGYAVANPPQD